MLLGMFSLLLLAWPTMVHSQACTEKRLVDVDILVVGMLLFKTLLAAQPVDQSLQAVWYSSIR